MKKLIRNLKDWINLKKEYSEKGYYLQSEDEKEPKEYPCIVVETIWYEGCRSVDDQFCKFVYLKDFTTKEIRKQKIIKIEI